MSIVKLATIASMIAASVLLSGCNIPLMESTSDCKITETTTVYDREGLSTTATTTTRSCN